MSKLDFGDKEYVFFRDQIIEDVERLFGTIER